MAKPVGLSCPICLQADEPGSMLTVHIEHGLAVREFDVSLCGQCVAAVVAAVESAINSAAAGTTGAAPADADQGAGEGDKVKADGSSAEPGHAS